MYHFGDIIHPDLFAKTVYLLKSFTGQKPVSDGGQKPSYRCRQQLALKKKIGYEKRHYIDS